MKLNANGLSPIRKVDECLVSYNIEMTEITGGTFWKEYTPEQIAGTAAVPQITDFSQLASMMQYYEPIDLTEDRIRTYAKALGKAWIRVSGSWATDTYYDFDGHTGGVVPEGYRAILTRERWTQLLDFVKAVDGKLLISVSNCRGDHLGGKPWTPEQAKLLFDFSRDYGMPIQAAEFMNEPNVMGVNLPADGYTAADYSRDQDAFYRFVRQNYPEVLLVGPCCCGDATVKDQETLSQAIRAIPTPELMKCCTEKPDVFSYHSYAGISERGAAMGGHWDASETLSDAYLGVAAGAARFYAQMRDTYCPGGQMWVTESADAGMGGNTWGSTYLDVMRYAEELCSFATVTDGVIFHNTLASSDYGLLDHSTHQPRPNYWMVYVWQHLIGQEIYAVEGAKHLYAWARKDGKPGYVYVAINNGQLPLELEVPVGSQLYQLHANELRGHEILLNGKRMERKADGTMPELEPVIVEGTIRMPAASVAFLVV